MGKGFVPEGLRKVKIDGQEGFTFRILSPIDGGEGFGLLFLSYKGRHFALQTGSRSIGKPRTTRPTVLALNTAGRLLAQAVNYVVSARPWWSQCHIVANPGNACER